MQERPTRKTTLVVPYRVHASRDESAKRLRRLLAHVPEPIAIIVIDDSSSSALRRPTEALVGARAGARYINAYPGYDRPFSVGRSRDIGSTAAETEFVLFHDVDFIGPQHVYANLNDASFLEALFGDNPKAFACIPVLFLDKAATAILRAAAPLWGKRVNCHLRDFFSKTNRGRLVLGSSAILTRRTTLLDSGGHSEAFEGHGAEDFELLHRLSTAYPIGERPTDYAEDCGSAARPLTGFRAYFAQYGEVALAQGVFLYHPWHKSRHEDAQYWGLRKDNFARLKCILSSGRTL